MTESGLSQWVVCGGTPYSIEIFKTDATPGWRVDAIDAVAREVVWTGTAPDDATALLQAITQIHARNEAQEARAEGPNSLAFTASVSHMPPRER